MKFSFHDIWGDLRFAVRSLRRSRGFAISAIVSLALGVALTASTLAVMNSYLVRLMPYPAADRLYRVLYDSGREREPERLEAVDWRSLKDVVEVADASSLDRFVLETERYPQEIFALLCSSDSIAALGLGSSLGRSFIPQDFQPGGEKVSMISHALWRERFGSDPQIVGKTVRARRASSGTQPTEYRVVGVLPAGFRYVGNYLRGPADIAVPLTEPRTTYLARLRKGVPPAFAARRIAEAVRSAATAVPANWTGVRLESVQADYVRAVRPVLVGVTVAAALVLLIVVTNVAVLMLLRALRRQKETAVRIALGAERGHIARLLLAESMTICSIAVAFGLGLAAIILRALAPQIESNLGRPVPEGVAALAIDWHVLAWTGGAGVLIVACISCLPLFLRSSGALLVAGITGGLFSGAAVSRILQSQLHGVARFDPWTLASAAVFLLGAGLLATWLPTRRVARTDPMIALRAE